LTATFVSHIRIHEIRVLQICTHGRSVRASACIGMVKRIEGFGPELELPSLMMGDRDNSSHGEGPILPPWAEESIAPQIADSAEGNDVAELAGGSWRLGIEIQNRTVGPGTARRP